MADRTAAVPELVFGSGNRGRCSSRVLTIVILGEPRFDIFRRVVRRGISECSFETYRIVAGRAVVRVLDRRHECVGGRRPAADRSFGFAGRRIGWKVAAVAGSADLRAHVNFVIQIDCARIGILQFGKFRMRRVETHSGRSERLVARRAACFAYGAKLRLKATVFDVATGACADGSFLAVSRPVMAGEARFVGNEHLLAYAGAFRQVAKVATLAENRVDLGYDSGAVGVTCMPDGEREHPSRCQHDRGER